MPDIQDPGPGRKLQRRYRLIGTTPAPFLSPELVPVVLIDDLTEETPAIDFAIVGDLQAAVVAERSQTGLRNPAASNMTIEQVELRFVPASLSNYRLGVTGPALAVLSTPIWQDSGRSGVPVGEVLTDTDAAGASGVLCDGSVLANTLVVIPLPNYVIQPGDQIRLSLETLNVTFRFWWTWGERRAE